MLEDVAAALARRATATRPRRRSSAPAAIDELARDFDEALDVGRETAASRRRAGARCATVETTPRRRAQIDLAVRNVRVLARGARRAIELDENVPPEVAGALRELGARRSARSAARSTTPATAPRRCASPRCAPPRRRRGCSSAPATCPSR